MITQRPDPALDAFVSAVSVPDEEIDLARAALVIAQAEQPDLDVEGYLESLRALAGKVVKRAGPRTTTRRQVRALIDVVHRELGLRGVRADCQEEYYDPRNSFLNHVLDRRIGIPISLSVVLMSVGARAGIPLGGIDMPIHFLVRVLGLPEPLMIDCFDSGRLLSRLDCARMLKQMSGGRWPFRPDMLEIVSNASILSRMLTNLLLTYHRTGQLRKAVAILDRMLVLNPDQPAFLRNRGVILCQLGELARARPDLERYLQCAPQTVDTAQIRRLLKSINR